MKLKVDDLLILTLHHRRNHRERRDFKVSGIYKSGLEEFDRRFAFIDHRWVNELLGWGENQYSHIEVHVEDIDKT